MQQLLSSSTRSAGPASLELREGRASAVVDLAGGRLASLAIDGLELLSAASPHGGAVHLQPWELSDTATITSLLAAPAPAGGRAVQHFDLREDSLTITTEIHNTEQPMPAVAGWHPLFRRELDRGESAALSFQAAARYVTDRQGTPTGDLEPVPPTGPWHHCMTCMQSGPAITWAGAVQIRIASTFDHWMIDDRDDRAILVAPQSGPPNQMHLKSHTVEPGHPLIGSMTLAWG